MLGDLGYNSKFKGDVLKDKMPTERLEMLVDLYAPSLKPDVEAIKERLQLLARIVADVILQKDRSDEWKSKTVEASAIASIEITKLATEAKRKLALLVQPIVASAG